MEFKFSEENLKIIEAEKHKYPNTKPLIMKALYLGQEQNGYVTKEVMAEVANILQVDKEDVLGVATFYTMFHKEKVGKYHLQVCTNVSCMLRGGYDIMRKVMAETGLKNGDVTDDGKFSLEEVECMGACGGAPMVAVNEDYIENITPEKVTELIQSLRNK